MKTVEADGSKRLLVGKENIISMPVGLLGFEQVKRYVLLATAEEEPFMWLQMLDHPSQGFVVVPPAAVLPGYAPDIAQADIDDLGIKSPEDAILLTIVTVRNGERTVNLKGPIVINRNTLVARQCIPINVAAFALQQSISPIPVAA